MSAPVAVCPLTSPGLGDGLVFLGLIGLTLMEFGLARQGFGNHLMFKNWIQFSVGIVAWWLLGYGFSFGEAGPNSEFIGEKFFGGDEWLLDRQANHGSCASYNALVGFFVLFIINGAISERAHYFVYPVVSGFLMLFVWPVIVSWIWGGGWIQLEVDNPAIDFGGAITVFMFAGAFGLIGAIIVGKRVGRFDGERTESQFVMTNYPWYTIGSTLTILGVFGITIANAPVGTGIAEVNSWICGGVSSIVSLKLLTFNDRSLKQHYIAVFQGFIAGQVFISSSAFDTTPWQAGLCGIIAGILFFLGVKLVNSLKIDDVMNITGTFFLTGFFGGLLPGFITDNDGVFWEGATGQTLGAQTVAVVVITAWSIFWAVITFGILKVLNKVRLPNDLQAASLEGTQITQMGFVKGHDEVHPTEKQ